MFGKLRMALAGWFAPAECQGTIVKEIKTIEELDECIRISDEKPVFLFKHSTRCPVSFGANARVGQYIETHDAANGDLPEIYLVKVVESRAVSNAIQEKLGVDHQSPQMILLDKGRPVWNASHHHITPEAIDKALEHVAV